ncbi:MAG: LCP family protein [Eubacteriaceae bacterium]|jgi:LCP family protein required for cell wall assembly|nr:LCP family protein [Eubacteriaceae bacterium]
MSENGERDPRPKKVNSVLYIAAVAMIFAEAFFAVLFVYRLYVIAPPRIFAWVASIVFLAVVTHYSLIVFRDKRANASSMASVAFSLVFIAAFSYVLGVLMSFFSSLEAIQGDSGSPAAMQLYVLRTSESQGVEEAKSMLIGVRGAIDADMTRQALSEIATLSGGTPGTVIFQDFDSMASSLKSKEVDAILLKDSYMPLVDDNFEGFSSSVRPIYSYESKAAPSSGTQLADLAKTPFCAYISGVDASGQLSDVNVIVTVNPVAHEILLTNVPRDYYVYLDGDPEKPDKLTHSGIYGIGSSKSTIEKLMGIKINYYVNVSFRSVVNIVDAVGGIDVYSERDFTSIWSLDRRITYSYTTGLNHLDGRAALAFARERKQFASGDRMRSQNQEAVIKAIIQKMLSPSIIANISPILKAVTSNTLTDIRPEQILSLIRMQLADSPTWKISSFNLDGEDATRRCFSTGGYSFVIVPDEDMVYKARGMIAEVLRGREENNSDMPLTP